MARVPTGIVKQFAKQKMLVKQLEIDGIEMVGSNRVGPVRYVDSVTGSASNLGLTASSPISSIDIAVGLCTASRGDVIVALPGHVETVTAAGGLDLDVAGITVYFLGEGANRAKINFTTATTADMDVDAANITLVNPLFIAGIDALAGPIDVNAADFTIIDGEWRDAAAMGTTDCIVADANADRMRILGWTYVDSTTGTQKQSNIQIAGADDIIIKNFNIVGDFGTGAIENGTAWVNAYLDNGYIDNKSASPTVGILLQATSTGTMRNVDIRVASGTTYLTANNDMQFFNCYGTGTDATAGELIGTGLASDLEAKVDVITSVLSGTDGIASFPAGALAANAVSLAEVVRYISEHQAPRVTVKNFAAAGSSLTTGLSPVAAFTVTGTVMLRIFGAVGATPLASTLNNGTLAVGISGSTTTYLGTTTADGTNFIASAVWIDTSPTLLSESFVAANLVWHVNNGAPVIVTVATNSMTAGILNLYCEWKPVSAGATVVAA